MRAARYLGPTLFIAGVVALAYALIEGEATLNLFLVFPIVTASGPWGFLGILLIVAGFAAFFFTWPSWGEIPRESVPATAVSPPPTATAATPLATLGRRRLPRPRPDRLRLGREGRAVDAPRGGGPLRGPPHPYTHCAAGHLTL